MKKNEKQTENKKKIRMRKIGILENAEGGIESDIRESAEGKLSALTARLSALKDRLKKDPAAIARKIARGSAMAVLAFLFGRTSLLLDTYTPGMALLSASGSDLPFILTGALISALFVNAEGGVIFSPHIYMTAYILIFLIRIASRALIDPIEGFSIKQLISRKTEPEERKKTWALFLSSLFGENLYLRMACACAGAFFVSLWNLSAGSYRYYDLFSAMFAMISAPAITFLMSGFWKKATDKTDKALRIISELTLLSCAVLSLKGTIVLGINTGVFAAFFAVLYLAEKRGTLYCCAAGFAAGLAISPLCAPAFILAAIAASLMRSSPLASSALAALLALLWGAYIDGIAALTLFMPAIITASVIYCATGRLFTLSVSDLITAEASKAKEEASFPGTADARERLQILEKTFSAISADLYAITDKLKYPSRSEIRSISLNSFEKHCENCPSERICRGASYGDFSEMVTKLGEMIERDGRAKKEKLPNFLSEGCINIEKVMIEANTCYGELMAKRFESEKTQLFAIDYEAFSHLLADAAQYIRDENTIDRSLTERLVRELRESELGMREIYAYGKDKKKIYSGDIGRKAEKRGATELKAELERACGFPLSDPIFELAGSKIAMRAEASERFSVECAGASSIGQNELECGDSNAFFTKNGKSYALICDGMGSGDEAALTSRICVLFLKRMLEGGNRKEIALKMLNNLLRSKSAECSTTVDLMEIDLVSGNASFVKSGAAPSFVRRGDKLYKLRSATAPIGIMNAIDAEQVKFEIIEGDLIIMLSDGLGMSPEESCWLMEMLGGEIDTDLKKFAEDLIDRAVKEGETDDATVLLVKINGKKSDVA